MNVSTHGIKLRTSRRWLADGVELMSSMRFAISVLTVIAFASAIGTVLTQGDPLPNYVNQFGPFWFQVFSHFSLYEMYSSWWFMLIMAFLVISTSLCVVRNSPRMLADAKSWRDTVREQSLVNFHHHASWQVAQAPAELAERLVKRVRAAGYKARLVPRDEAILLTAKQGAANKWGYIFAHAAIVVICLGALLDSTLPITFQKWVLGKSAYTGTGVIAAIPASHRLSIYNPTFRGNTFIPEGLSSSTTMIAQNRGVLVQDLPFSIELKKFTIDYYSTGMPKRFLSDVVIRDRQSGVSFPSKIEVNHPLIYRGIAVYQSSFEDGGSTMHLSGYPLYGDGTHPADTTTPVPVKGVIGDTTPLTAVGMDGKPHQYTLEWTGFRAFNVESTAAPGNASGTGEDVRTVAGPGKAGQASSLTRDLQHDLGQHMGSAAKPDADKNLHNVGPSLQYKLRDASGQATEFNTYMRPVDVNGDYVFLTGMRTLADAPFEYLRIPADDNDSLTEWLRLRAALHDPAQRQRAAALYARHAMAEGTGGADNAAMREQLQKTSEQTLGLFADGGFQGLAKFWTRIPAGEQQKAADIFLRVLSGSLWDLWQSSRHDAGLPPAPADEAHSRYMVLAMNALSDAFLFHAPLYLQLDSFEQVQASVFQVTRSPGKKFVYLGSLFLVLGIVSMLYLRERRLWVWIKPGEEGSGMTSLLMAMSAQRRTLDFEKEFEQMKLRLDANQAV